MPLNKINGAKPNQPLYYTVPLAVVQDIEYIIIESPDIKYTLNVINLHDWRDIKNHRSSEYILSWTGKAVFMKTSTNKRLRQSNGNSKQIHARPNML